MMSAEGVVQRVIAQVVEVQAEQPDLELLLRDSGGMVVRGAVRFNIEHEERVYLDSYQVEISIPPDYPAAPPSVTETGGMVPTDFHRFPETGNLCLAAPVELVRVFARDRTLRHYVNGLLIPYLFSFTYFREHGQMPHGELGHGTIGLFEYYRDFFAIHPILAMKLLKLLADGSTPPLMRCPCNSGRRLRDCHGPKLDELRPLLPPQSFAEELREMITMAMAADIKLPERDVMPKRMLRNRKKQHQGAKIR